ncbi:MAG TPA: formyltetrahydrofolate deformylase [Gammaproteobacteria bacterium]|nr:formyltetrahydrofolate deformylase [Gammaproteobacteria bacterium]
MPRHYTITLSCPDRPGIIAAVSSFIAAHGGSIGESASHTETQSRHFFMRVEILAQTLPFGLEELRARFVKLADEFNMQWQIADSAVKKRVVILVSKQEHCLSDLLYRWRSREFEFDIPCVISNHDDTRGIVEWHEIPYIHVPIVPENKLAAHQEILRFCERHQADAIVLARYMQVLPDFFCVAYPSRVINIHHGLLPAFVGARPYHQAFERGVKQIGATCHYVTQELDAGPIIEQDIIRVDHTETAEDLIRLGKDVEKTVLSRGVRYHVEDRVLVHGSRTMVFR